MKFREWLTEAMSQEETVKAEKTLLAFEELLKSFLPIAEKMANMPRHSGEGMDSMQRSLLNSTSSIGKSILTSCANFVQGISKVHRSNKDMQMLIHSPAITIGMDNFQAYLQEWFMSSIFRAFDRVVRQSGQVDHQRVLEAYPEYATLYQQAERKLMEIGQFIKGIV